jgi:NAD(P)-dependent dehydrogenase (short-subunit alcohol dehydrogenase family)
MAHWTASDIPSQKGRIAIITGTGGLGLEDALMLAQAGAQVIIAGRNPTKGQTALDHVHQQVANANVRFEVLDLANLASIYDFSVRLKRQINRLDILVNNAAIMTPPQRQSTADGFELQFGTNYLGHFALTAHLLPLLRQGQDPRVVTISSIANRSAMLHFDDLQAQQKYEPMLAYGQSKLACLMFALELQRKSDTAGWGITSLAAHPGVSRTDLIPNGAGANSFTGRLRKYLWFLFQSPAQGALPTLYAATAPSVQGGGYYGPHKLSETRGFPAEAKIPPQALELETASRLWKISEDLTGTRFH